MTQGGSEPARAHNPMREGSTPSPATTLSGYRLGLVLTGGGLQGVAAQTGALAALEECGIRPAYIVGTSAGSLTGALYSVHGAERMREVVLRAQLSDYWDPPPPWSVLWSLIRRQWRGETGYLRGLALERWLESVLGNVRFSEVPHYACVSVNLNWRDRWVWSARTRPLDPVWWGVRASTSLPVVFSAFQDGYGEWHTDGGATDNVPIQVLVDEFPDVERILVITTLSLDDDGEPSDSFLHKDWTPLRVIERNLRAIDEARTEDSQDAEGRGVDVLTIRGLDIGLDETDKVPGGVLEAARQARAWLRGEG